FRPGRDGPALSADDAPGMPGRPRCRIVLYVPLAGHSDSIGHTRRNAPFDRRFRAGNRRRFACDRARGGDARSCGAVVNSYPVREGATSTAVWVVEQCAGPGTYERLGDARRIADALDARVGVIVAEETQTN